MKITVFNELFLNRHYPYLGREGEKGEVKRKRRTRSEKHECAYTHRKGKKGGEEGKKKKRGAHPNVNQTNCLFSPP